MDFLFPKRCVACGRFGSYLCDEDRKKIEPAKSFCPVCLKAAISGTTHSKCKSKLSLDGLICIFDYKSPTKELIAQLKYRFVRELTEVVRAELKKTKSLDNFDFREFILVPIPLSAGRKNWRGFNQAEILGQAVAKRLKLPFKPEILKKIKETRPQAKLARSERLRQMRGTFASENTAEIEGGKFIIFDDVWTTGATMKAAAATLKRKGAGKVWGVALSSSH